MPGEAILRTDRVSVHFGGLAALKDASLTVRDGEVHGLIGPNGAGKTTLTNAISGLVRPTAGRIYFQGEDITYLGPHRIARMGLARTFQLAQVFPRLDCVQNAMVGRHSLARGSMLGPLRYPPFVRPREEEETRRRALELLEWAGIADLADRFASELVWVQCQLLQMARCLISDPKLLILDEPTAGMGFEESEVIARLIRAIRDRGVTVVLISHDVRLVMENADRVTVLNFGETICEGPPSEVQADSRVREAYLGT
jgi:branched-chain amino acid transport system ATP-binding protein